MATDALPRFRVFGGSGGGGGGSASALARLVRFLDGAAGAAVVGLVSAEAAFRLRVEGGAGGITSAAGAEAARLSLADERVTLGDMRRCFGVEAGGRERDQNLSLRSMKHGLATCTRWKAEGKKSGYRTRAQVMRKREGRKEGGRRRAVPGQRRGLCWCQVLKVPHVHSTVTLAGLHHLGRAGGSEPDRGSLRQAARQGRRSFLQYRRREGGATDVDGDGMRDGMVVQRPAESRQFCWSRIRDGEGRGRIQSGYGKAGGADAGTPRRGHRHKV
jgi:hypothetical protein